MTSNSSDVSVAGIGAMGSAWPVAACPDGTGSGAGFIIERVPGGTRAVFASLGSDHGVTFASVTLASVPFAPDRFAA